MSRALLLAHARDALGRAGIPSPAHDAEALLLHALAISRTELWADPDRSVGEEAAARFADLLDTRARRVPLQHLLGEMPFHGATLFVEPGVFIPRPETEQLVERALEELRASACSDGPEIGPGARPGSGSYPERGTILDLGSGTGAISVALLLALPPGWTAAAVDRSDRACALASRNARRNGVEERMTVAVADLHDAAPPSAVAAPVELLVSNPPYVPSGAIAGLMPEVRDHDPREALDGGPDGLDSLRAVAHALPARLKPGGVLALEIGEDQADASMELFGPLLRDARVSRDLAGRPRVLVGRMRGRER